MDQTGEELCLWQNEAPDKLIWKVIASKTNVIRPSTVNITLCLHGVLVSVARS